MMAFRRAKMADLPDILRLVGEARAFMAGLGIDQWQDGYPNREVLARDVDLGQLYLFEDGGRAAAVAALSLEHESAYDALDGRWLSDGAYLTVHRMALDDAHRGGGLASAMMDEAEKLARAHHCKSVRVDTHRGNRAMRRFLEKRGFALCGEVNYFVRQGDPVRVAYEKLV